MESRRDGRVVVDEAPNVSIGDTFNHAFDDSVFIDSWLLIRPSGTETIIRLICESENKTRMNELIKKGRRLVELCTQ